MANTSKKGHSGNPAKAAQQERERLERQREQAGQSSRKESLSSRLGIGRENFELAFTNTPKWTRWISALGLVLATLVIAWSWMMLLSVSSVTWIAWAMLLVATAGLLAGYFGMFSARNTWVMVGIVLAAIAPTGNFYLLNTIAMVCGIALAWGISSSNRY